MTGKLLLRLLCPWRKHAVVAHWELETLIPQFKISMYSCFFFLMEKTCVYMLDSCKLNVNISLYIFRKNVYT